MLLSASNPVFTIYAISCLVLVAHLLFLWGWSGVVRSKTKTAVNPEDAEKFGATLVPADPPEVARVMRVYENALSICVPFFIVALLVTALDGGRLFAEITFGTFVGVRLLYAVVYLRGAQPWRTLLYTVSAIVLVVMLGDAVYLLLRR